MKKIFTLMIPIIALCSCAQDRPATPGIDLADLDESVSPKVDFYRYATGGWQKNNPLKPEYARYGSFDILGENNEKRLNELFQSMSSLKAAHGSVEQKISDLYRMGLDSLRRNGEGAAPLKPYIDGILAISDKDALVREVAAMHLAWESPFFGIYVMADMTDSDSNIIYMGQSGLGMGDRDYYVKGCDPKLKSGYLEFLTGILGLAGLDNAAGRASDALEVEDKLAENSWTSVECRDIERQYNPTTFAELAAEYPHLRLGSYFEALGVKPEGKIVVTQPTFFKALDAMFASENVEVLKNYLLTQLIQGACEALSDDFYDASFDFFSRQMAGVQQQKPRWKRAMSVPNSLLSEAVGEMYVKKYFPEKDKKRVAKMVSDIQTALAEHIDSLDWMSDATKARAQEKLNAFTVKIGYPDTWKDYSTLEVNPSASYYENIRQAALWSVQDNLTRLGKPVDKAEWLMSPQTVNAYYNPPTNEICFPAAILQPPFYNPDADDAVNYGAIGVVIGHEMTHGFDDQGRNFDKDGNMNNWWTDADAAAFKAKTDRKSVV